MLLDQKKFIEKLLKKTISFKFELIDNYSKLKICCFFFSVVLTLFYLEFVTLYKSVIMHTFCVCEYHQNQATHF